ncbi:amino acid ABC transporter ATP-binding protein [Weissella confusa]|uniref:amino acid ABC transporter ATP-binding protein n=1 Tax=Weissella confusa TaxID=1583 RepID=UPI00223B9374|nr:amino acid ABC transporter ATP-binding protein [Weissella confusa]MCT0023204.1 amino acid ABC transporter ATP-binding protein [Weissella confusa]
MAILTIKNFHKEYGDKVILKDINASVEEGDVIALLGPSGTGKSTLLRGLNMLDRPTSGEVIFDGQDISKATETESDKIRQDMGMVFQSFNLFPNMSVIDNVKIALLKVKGMADDEATQIAEKFLAKVGLAEKAQAYPASLSGGQQQRVAIARALAMYPKIMLFDEPTSALDPEMVGEVLKTMRELAQEGMTMLVVTHEMGFAREVASKIWFMADGDMTQYDNPEAFFENPDSERAQSFLAKML